MGRDESGKPIGHLARVGRIETNQERGPRDIRLVSRPHPPHRRAV